MANGWIKLHRKIKDSDLYPKNREFTKYEAWLDLLMIANHNDKNVVVGNDVMFCKRGQSVRSIESYQKQWNWTRQQVRCFFDLLVRLEMITKETTSKTTILTICNYDTYQGEQPTENQQNENSDNNQQNNHQKTNKAAMLNNSETEPCRYEQPSKNHQSNQHYNHKQEVNNYKKNNNSVIFDQFRTEYPGTKRGLKTEFENFIKKNKLETVHLLLPALKTEKQHREALSKSGQFIPQWKNLQTWINQKCWEQEFPEVKQNPEIELFPQPKLKAI